MGERLRIGKLWIDRLTFGEALDAIERLVASGRGGTVFTPNVDHVVLAESHAEFDAAYAQADLSLVDGKPLLWASRLLGVTLPEKISGSDLLVPLLERAGQRGWRVYLYGGADGVAAEAAEKMHQAYGVNVVGTDAPRIRADGTVDDDGTSVRRIRDAKTQLLLLALGAPKQELFAFKNREALGPAVAVGIGASLDFLVGRVKRAPRWMSEVGLEWFYRLMQEPGRLWRRYLLNDPKFVAILARSLRAPAEERVQRQ